MPGVKPEGHLLGEDTEYNPSFGFGCVDEPLVVEATDRHRPPTLLETLIGKARLRDYVLLLIIVLAISD